MLARLVDAFGIDIRPSKIWIKQVYYIFFGYIIYINYMSIYYRLMRNKNIYLH